MTVDEHTRSQGSLPLPGSSDGGTRRRRELEVTTRGGDVTARGSDSYVAGGPEDLPPGTEIGRYMILSRLGAGAMGVVYAAYDPELDRKVALKLLHSRAGGSLDNRARLLREAKALARLSHPNVVAVHDVGTYGERVFLAMEFVAGRTLTAWLKDQPRRWPEVVAVLRRAGEGLAAAHEAGLVHRDFKPDNVLIGEDGRVRVLDFGLARSATEAPEAAADDATLALLSSASSTRRSREREAEQILLTRTGALVGTPAYMSPEQHLGHNADGRSDQFAFCITLYQALYGSRPFSAPRLSALAFQIIQGKVEAAPPGSSVPTWLRKVVVRGLQVDPGERWPSMRALIAALDRDRGKVRRGGWVLAAAGARARGRGRARGPSAEPPCRGAAARLAEIWDEPRIAAIERAIVGTGLPYASAAWKAARADLDAYAAAWISGHNEACAATEVRHEHSPQLLDLRMRCLERRRVELRAVSDALLAAAPGTIEHAHEVVGQLGELAACEDLDALLAVVPPPDSPAQRQQVAQIEDELAQASARELAGDLTQAEALSARAHGAATQLAYPPLVADALIVRARVQERLSATDAARLSLVEATLAAARGRDDRAAARAWVDLVQHTGVHQPEEGRLFAYERAAEAAIVRAGDDPHLRARKDIGVASGLVHLRRHDEALARIGRAIEVLERDTTGEPVRLAGALNILALAYKEQRRLTEARAAFERALVVLSRVCGPEHPVVATFRNNQAEVALDRGDLEEAEKLAREAYALRQRALPEGHLDRAASLLTLGSIAQLRGDLAAAERHFLDALAIYREHPDAHPMHKGGVYNDLANLAAARGELDTALGHYRDALEVFRARFGEDAEYVRLIEANIAETLVLLGRPGEALPLQERVLAATERVDGPGAPEAAIALRQLGQILLALGRAADARPLLERALQIYDAPPAGAEIDAVEAAMARATLARVLAVLKLDRGRQKTLTLLAEPTLAAAAAANSAAAYALAVLRGEAGRPAAPG